MPSELVTTPIEWLAAQLPVQSDIQDLLVPEQCMAVWWRGKLYHVIIQEVPQGHELDAMWADVPFGPKPNGV